MSLYANIDQRIYDYTALNTFQICPRRFYWNNVRDLIPIEASPYLHYGKALHGSIEAWYLSNKNIDTMMEKLRELMQGMPPDPSNKRTLTQAEKLLKAYTLRYANEPFKVVATEKTLSWAMPDGSTLVGQLDCVVETEGRFMPLETKTTSYSGEQFIHAFKPNMQIDIYIYLVNKIYGNCNEARINVLEVKGETSRKPMAERIYRFPTDRTPEEMQSFEKQYTHLVQEVERAIQEGYYVQATNACTYYGKCPYHLLCSNGSDERLVPGNYMTKDKLKI